MWPFKKKEELKTKVIIEHVQSMQTVSVGPKDTIFIQVKDTEFDIPHENMNIFREALTEHFKPARVIAVKCSCDININVIKKDIKEPRKRRTKCSK